MTQDICAKVDEVATKIIETPIIDDFKMFYCDTDEIAFRIVLRYHNYEIMIGKSFFIRMATTLFMIMDKDIVANHIKNELRKQLLEYLKL